jgi:hypothetical protein
MIGGMNPMRKNSNNVSEKNRTIGMLAIAAFLMLFASTLGVGWVSLGAVAGTPVIDDLGDPMPEPTGGWGSGWINDTVTEVLGVDCRDPAMATGPGGVLHAVFQCNVAIGGWGIFYTSSTDGGETWLPQRGAANTADDETDPDIAVSPDDGRIFVVYERLIAPGNRNIWATWSDDGVTWNAQAVVTFTGDDVNPSVAVEHNQGLLYYVYLAMEAIVDIDNRNVLVYRTTDRGLNWAQQLNHGGVDTNVYSDPDICYQSGTDGNDYLYVAFVEGVDAADMYEISIIWSDDYGATWSAPFTIATRTDFVNDPSIAGSRDGDKLAVVFSYANAGDRSIVYGYDHDPTTPDAGWSVLTRGNTATNTLTDLAPEVKADGEGTTSTTIGGNFHLIWTQAAPDNHIIYSTMTSTGAGFSGMAVATDLSASATYPWKGLTTQERGGTWYPCLNYAEFSTGIYDLDYTTHGMRSMVDTNPSGLNINVDGAPLAAPVFFNWPAGLSHNLFAPSPQAIGPTSQWAWVDWSDAGAQGHAITAGTIDTNYTANYITQYQVTIDTLPVNLDIEIDLVPTLTPAIMWWDDGSVHDLVALSPQVTLPGIRYVYQSWSDGMAQAHQITVTGSETITATYVRQYYVEVFGFDTTNALPLNGIQVTLDGPVVGNTPWGGWLVEGQSYDIGVEDPYNDGFQNYNFVDWDFGPVQNPVPYVPNAPAMLTANYVVAPATAFSLEVAPLTRTIAPGGTTTYTITLTSLSGYAGDVQLSASALPAGLLPPATATFLPNPATVPLGGQITSTLTIDNTAAVPEDTYTITVSGQDTISAAISDSNDTELIVIQPTFTVAVTPPLRTIAPGQTTTYDVTVESVSGYSGSVTLSHAGLPGAVTGTFLPNPVIVPAGGNVVSVLTIDNTAGEPDAVYPFTVTGDDGNLPPVIDGADLQISTVAFYSMTATPATRQVSPGGATSFTVTATSVNTYAGAVDVSVSHTLTAADASFSWTKTTLNVPDGGSDFAVLTVDTNPGIADGDYTLTFFADDGAQNETDDSTLNVSASLPGSISGTVEDENGDPIENADVELVDSNDQIADTTTSDSSGDYTFADVDPGTYTVRASMTGYVDDERSVTLAGGEDKTGQDLELKFGSIEGVVVDENGDPVPDATVEVIDENGDVVGTDTTNSQGVFEVDDLLLGTYTVRISADGFENLTV